MKDVISVFLLYACFDCLNGVLASDVESGHLIITGYLHVDTNGA
jgi:hypothetical protein